MEQKRSFIISAIYYLLIAGAAYLTLKYALAYLMPFILGFLAAAVTDPAVRILSARFGLKKKPAGILILLIFYATIGMLATVIVVRLTVLAGEFSKALPEIYNDSIEPALNIAFGHIEKFLERLDNFFGDSSISGDELGGIFGSVRSSIGKAVSELSVKLITRLSGMAASIPGMLVKMVFALISGFFFAADFDRIISYVKEKLPAAALSKVCGLWNRLRKTLGKYAGSYALIMLITFAELSLGLLFVGIRRPFGIAFGIALFDILPVLGSGGILVPWAVIELFGGDVKTFTGLIVVWVIISIVRNIIEPKIVGKQVGLHPLATLISMYLGAKLFGFVGMFVCPILISIYSQGVSGDAE